MASFTDKPAQFNPYIPQLPVQAMVEVGMEKQRRYDEGVERIQQSIDRIMDFDIVKPGHKEYLQSQLSELGQNLRFVAAGDFSDNQLVKSVSGLSGKIARDPIIQNAVTSTAMYRQETELMKSDRKEGKLSPQNEYNFNKYSAEWFKDPDLASPFGVRYIPDIGIAKKLGEVFDKLKPDGYETDDVFQRDANKNIIMQTITDPQTGAVSQVPVFSDVMTTLSREGIFPEKVKEVLGAFMSDPSVARQLQIDAEYIYKDYQGSDLVGTLKQERDSSILALEDHLDDLEIKQALSTNEEERKAIGIAASKVKDTINQVDAQFYETAEQAVLNPDAVKGLLHSSKMKKHWTGMYTSVKEKESHKVNPYFETAMKRQDMANDMFKWRMDYEQDERKIQQDNYWKGLEYQLSLAKEAREQRAAAGEEATPSSSGFMIDSFPGDQDYLAMYNSEKSQVYKNYDETLDDLIVNTTLKGYDWKAYLGVGREVSAAAAKRTLIGVFARRAGLSLEEYRAKQEIKILNELNNYPELGNDMKVVRDSYLNASRGVKYYQDKDGFLNRIAPLSANPSKDEIKRREDAVKKYLMLYPPMTTEVLTGVAKVDTPRREIISALIGSYETAHGNEAGDFRGNANAMTNIAKDEKNGTIKLRTEYLPSTGGTKNSLIFFTTDGKVAGEMAITEYQMRHLGFSAQGLWGSPLAKNAAESLSVNGGSTSIGDPSKPQTYVMNDAFFVKKDFKMLAKAPFDIKANIRRYDYANIDGTMSTVYVPYIYINGKTVGTFIRPLPALLSVEAAVEVIERLDENAINNLLLERAR